MLERIPFPIWVTASVIGFNRSRNSSLQFSFRNVFMLSPEQKVIQRVEIVATNIPTLAIVVSSINLLVLKCVVD